jgi:hypothetical protein
MVESLEGDLEDQIDVTRVLRGVGRYESRRHFWRAPCFLIKDYDVAIPPVLSDIVRPPRFHAGGAQGYHPSAGGPEDGKVCEGE